MFDFYESAFAPELAAITVFLVASLSLMLLHFVCTPWLSLVFTTGSFPKSAALKHSVENHLTVIAGVIILPLLIPCKLLFYRFRWVICAWWRKICWLYLYLVDFYDSIGVPSQSNIQPAGPKTKHSE